MRSDTATNSRPPAVVVRATKSRMALFALPSFHDGSGSLCAKAARVAATMLAVASPRTNERRSILPLCLRRLPTLPRLALRVICGGAWLGAHKTAHRFTALDVTESLELVCVRVEGKNDSGKHDHIARGCLPAGRLR